jgi:hypothetical protein
VVGGCSPECIPRPSTNLLESRKEK